MKCQRCKRVRSLLNLVIPVRHAMVVAIPVKICAECAGFFADVLDGAERSVPDPAEGRE